MTKAALELENKMLKEQIRNIYKSATAKMSNDYFAPTGESPFFYMGKIQAACEWVLPELKAERITSK